MAIITLTADQIAKMVKAQEIIYAAHNEIWNECHLNVLDNDCLSSLTLSKIVQTYDPSYTVNFGRNGVDAVANSGVIENKTIRLDGFTRDGVFVEANRKPNGEYPNCRKNHKYRGQFQFHAEGDLNYPRYIFGVLRKDTLEPLRIYDIRRPKNVNFVQEYLHTKRQVWLVKGKKKHDVIAIEETVLHANIKFTTSIVDGCEVLRS